MYVEGGRCVEVVQVGVQTGTETARVSHCSPNDGNIDIWQTLNLQQLPTYVYDLNHILFISPWYGLLSGLWLGVGTVINFYRSLCSCLVPKLNVDSHDSYIMVTNFSCYI